MMCPVCKGNVYTDMACDGCGITYREMISSIRHDNLRKLIDSEFKKLRATKKFGLVFALVREIDHSSFLVPATHIGESLHVMSVSDDKGCIFIPIFTDREAYDNNVTDIAALTNPFDLVLDLLDERFEGFVVNICDEEFELNREFLNKHFEGE